MRPIRNIRKNVFRLNQAEFAGVARTTQATISRWENGACEPSRDDLENIRAEALRRELPWDDRLFFEVPSEQHAS